MKSFMYIKNFKFGFVLSILFITACSSTPKQASADMTGISVSQVAPEPFESTHGSFRIVHTPAKNEFLILPTEWAQVGNMLKKSFALGLAGLEIDVIDKFEDAIFVDVFNQQKDSHAYLDGCSVTDLLKTKYQGSGVNAIELIYKCEDNQVLLVSTLWVNSHPSIFLVTGFKNLCHADPHVTLKVYSHFVQGMEVKIEEYMEKIG